MMGGAFAGGTIFFGLLYVVGSLLLFGLSIYFILTAINFMKEKNQNEREMLTKMDELIRLLGRTNLPAKNDDQE